MRLARSAYVRLCDKNGPFVTSGPLEERVGYPVDVALVGRWSVALAALAENADAPLPAFPGSGDGP